MPAACGRSALCEGRLPELQHIDVRDAGAALNNELRALMAEGHRRVAAANQTVEEAVPVPVMEPTAGRGDRDGFARQGVK